MSDNLQDRIIRLPDVKRKIGRGKSSIYAMEKVGEFPQRVKLGARSVGWIEREVDNWIANRIQMSRNVLKSNHDKL
jgi:prophage regulatory protein